MSVTGNSIRTSDGTVEAEFDQLTGTISGSVEIGDQQLDFQGVFFEDQKLVAGFFHDGDQLMGQMQLAGESNHLAALHFVRGSDGWKSSSSVLQGSRVGGALRPIVFDLRHAFDADWSESWYRTQMAKRIQLGPDQVLLPVSGEK